jgi:hypothetical protein
MKHHVALDPRSQTQERQIDLLEDRFDDLIDAPAEPGASRDEFPTEVTDRSAWRCCDTCPRQKEVD